MIYPCTNCNQPVKRCKSEFKKSKTGNVFCDSSCAAAFNNKIPKRKLKNKCRICSKSIYSQSMYCKPCYVAGHYLCDKTLEEATSHRKDANRYCNIRQASRREYLKSDKPKCCSVCGYERHFEVCHIKDIASFPLTTKVKEVNHLDNLVALCPTHHWELDHGFIASGAGGI